MSEDIEVPDDLNENDLFVFWQQISKGYVLKNKGSNFLFWNLDVFFDESDILKVINQDLGKGSQEVIGPGTVNKGKKSFRSVINEIKTREIKSIDVDPPQKKPKKETIEILSEEEIEIESNEPALVFWLWLI